MYVEFEKFIDYNFKNKSLLKQAFTHSSYAYESKIDTYLNNERLEFLGDAVLELTISNHLFKKYETMSEGDLTKFRASIVCEPTLAGKARKINAGKYLMLGKGEEQTGGRDRDSILADTIESIIGAIYLDGGFEASEKFILQMLSSDMENFTSHYIVIDYKTNLQEYYQSFSKDPLKYEIIKEEGPDHNKIFTAKLTHGDVVLGFGKGKSKKEAEQKAAFKALEKNNITF